MLFEKLDSGCLRVGMRQRFVCGLLITMLKIVQSQKVAMRRPAGLNRLVTHASYELLSSEILVMLSFNTIHFLVVSVAARNNLVCISFVWTFRIFTNCHGLGDRPPVVS